MGSATPFARRAVRTAVLLAIAATVAGPRADAPRDAAAAVAGLQSWLDGTRNLSGRFRQELVSGALGGGVLESGRFWLVLIGRFLWFYVVT
jgi:hypothetical protein